MSKPKRAYSASSRCWRKILRLSVVERGDPLLDGQEALALLQGQELVVHLGLPEVAPLLPADEPLLLQELAQGGEAGLVDEDVLLLLVECSQELAHGLRRPLHRLFEDGDPLEEMLVEREALLGGLFVAVLVVAQRSGQDQELLVATHAVFLIVSIRSATDLAVHPHLTQSIRKSPAPTYGRDSRHRPS